MKIRKLIREIKAERARQRAKWGRQRLSLRVWAWVWLEEVGEYCQAQLELRAAEIRADEEVLSRVFPMLKEIWKWQTNKDKELIQVLAVMVAFLQEYRPWHGVWRVR